jgi:hypothetical protein
MKNASMSTALIAGIWAAGDGIHGVLTYSAAGPRRTKPFLDSRNVGFGMSAIKGGADLTRMSAHSRF